MHYTLEKLLNGNSELISCYQAAKQKWDELFVERRNGSVSEWAEWLEGNQISFFEHQCGGRCFGQEVMAWSGFGALYSTQNGFGNNQPLAEKLAEAFKESGCSVEVISMARNAAASYL